MLTSRLNLVIFSDLTDKLNRIMDRYDLINKMVIEKRDYNPKGIDLDAYRNGLNNMYGEIETKLNNNEVLDLVSTRNYYNRQLEQIRERINIYSLNSEWESAMKADIKKRTIEQFLEILGEKKHGC